MRMGVVWPSSLSGGSFVSLCARCFEFLDFFVWREELIGPRASRL